MDEKELSDKINKQNINGLGKIMEELYTFSIENLCTFPEEELYPFPDRNMPGEIQSKNKMKLLYDKEP